MMTCFGVMLVLFISCCVFMYLHVIADSSQNSSGKEDFSRLSLLTMANPYQRREALLFVRSKMAHETSRSSKLPAAERTRDV